ncbi:MAG: HD domain-containing phosphohydrolase [Eubacteriales bacterium]
MEGVYINKLNIEADTPEMISADLKLLAKYGDTEIMEQTIMAGATVWLSPAEDPETLEFFFIHSGRIELELEDESRTLSSGETFTLKGLKKNIMVKARSNTKIIFVSNRPIFKKVHDFETYLKALLSQINEKDHYTYQHSMNVMNYSIAVYRLLHHGAEITETQLKNIVVASLFHDVGKCYTPDEILKKSGPLNIDEMRIIRHHPINSGRLLRKYYNGKIAEIAENHHERINGSGYPYGLTGSEMTVEAKVLAVVDAFDAMTTNRGYNVVKTFIDAADELCELPELFDAEISKALRELVKEGEIDALRDGKQTAEQEKDIAAPAL